MKPLIKRQYVRHELWEEVLYNMWGDVANEDEYAKLSLEIMRDHKQWGSFMIKVTDTWNNSCLHNLSNTSQNRIAWLGQAAVAYAIKCPEYIVRRNWSSLSDEEQTNANIEAQNAIDLWQSKYE